MPEKLKSLLESSLTDERILKKKFKTKIVTQGKNDLEFVKGRFSKVEISQIELALEEYLMEKNLERDQLYSLIHSKKSKQKVKGFFRDILQKSQVNRSVDQLYFYMSRKYSEISTKNERWTKQEDEKLMKLVEFKGFKWKEISQELERKDVKVRYEKISRISQGFATGKWTADETERFVQGKKMLEKKYKITNPTEFNQWTELSLLVKTRSFIQCRNKYIHSTYKIVKDFRVKWTFEDDTILLRRLKEFCSDAKDETEIIWNNIAFKEWVPWNGGCLQRRWTKLKERVSETRSFESFTDLLTFISENLKSISRTSCMNRDLLTFYSNQDTVIWSLEESRELLSHIITLFSDAKDEDDLDWESLSFSNWNGSYLRKKWLRIKEKLKPAVSLGFLDAVRFCQENLQNLNYEEDSAGWSSMDEIEAKEKLPEVLITEHKNVAADETPQSEEPSKKVKKRKKVKDQPPRKKKSNEIKSSEVIDDSSSDGESIRMHKKSIKKKNNEIKSSEVIDDSSSDGESIRMHKKSIKKKSNEIKSSEVIDDSSSDGESIRMHKKSIKKKNNEIKSSEVIDDSSSEKQSIRMHKKSRKKKIKSAQIIHDSSNEDE